jgi:voltage-gated chloride channel
VQSRAVASSASDERRPRTRPSASSPTCDSWPGAATGIPAAFLAAGFLGLVHYLEHWLWHSLPSALGHSTPPWYLVIGLPVAGACVVLAARRLLPGDGGHTPLHGIGGAATPVLYAPGIALAALGTLCFGAVLGPEAPLIALGSVVGMMVVPFTKLGEREQQVLGTAGSFSAISALFGGPITGGMMMVEGGLEMGRRLLPVLLPGFVAAALGYVIFVGFGTWGGLHQQSLAVPDLPQYNGTHIYDLIVAIVVGILAALVVTIVRRAAAAVAGPGSTASARRRCSSAAASSSASSRRPQTGSAPTRRSCSSPASRACPRSSPRTRRRSSSSSSSRRPSATRSASAAASAAAPSSRPSSSASRSRRSPTSGSACRPRSLSRSARRQAWRQARGCSSPRLCSPRCSSAQRAPTRCRPPSSPPRPPG